MMIQTSIFIKAPVERVFEAFSDLSKATERIAGISAIEMLEGPAMMQVGTKWKETRVMFGKVATEIMWVTKLEKNKRYVVEAASHGTAYRSEYLFEQKDGGTNVFMSFEGTPQTFAAKLMGIMLIFFAGPTRKALQQDMEDLKKVLELA